MISLLKIDWPYNYSKSIGGFKELNQEIFLNAAKSLYLHSIGNFFII